jgi:integrase
MTLADIELGDGITAHTLRHGFGSMLIRLGLDPVTVSKQMGHKNAKSRWGSTRTSSRSSAPRTRREASWRTGSDTFSPLEVDIRC